MYPVAMIPHRTVYGDCAIVGVLLYELMSDWYVVLSGCFGRYQNRILIRIIKRAKAKMGYKTKGNSPGSCLISFWIMSDLKL